SSQDDDIAHIQHALEIADSAMTYRSRYLNVFQVVPTIDLLLLDPTNPRSAALQIATILRHGLSLPKITPFQRKNFVKVCVTEARDLLVNLDAPTLSQADESGKRVQLIEFSAAIEEIMSRLSDAIADAYFQHASAQRAGAARRDAS